MLDALGLFEFHVIVTADNARTAPAIIRVRRAAQDGQLLKVE
jgi:hypothetical protein